MKNILTAIAIVTATSASADTLNLGGYVQYSQPLQTVQTQQVPYQDCHRESHVRPSNGNDVLAGMIVGALIGKGATGNDQGAAIGAVIGGVTAGDNNNRHETRQVCVTRYETRHVTITSGYETSVQFDAGFRHVFTTDRPYREGERVRFNLTLN